MSKELSKVSDSPSLGNATGTLLDSACKHIQQCRVSFDHMLHFVSNSDELEKREKDYCVHKDEMVVGVSRPWKKSKARQLPPSAYPRVISNLGNIHEDENEIPRKMIKYLFHFSSDLIQRHLIIENMNSDTFDIASFTSKGKNLSDDEFYFHDPLNTGNFTPLKGHLQKMHDYYPVGISNTLGYAHPNSGDTMSSVMIGGLRTVMNGDWEVQAGDKIQWYWSFERDCFRHDDGSRKSYITYDQDGDVDQDFTGCDPSRDFGDAAHPPDTITLKDTKRQLFNDRQYGVKPGSCVPSSKSKAVARIKTYVKDRTPRIYDEMRVFARAIGAARPHELLDIQICRQSM